VPVHWEGDLIIGLNRSAIGTVVERSSRYTLPELGVHTNPHLLAAIVVSALLQLGAVTLPFMQPLLEVSTGLSPGWLLILGLSVAPVSIVEIGKMMLAAVRRLP